MDTTDRITNELLKALKYINRHDLVNVAGLQNELGISSERCTNIIWSLLEIQYIYCYTEDDGFIDYIPEDNRFGIGCTLLGTKYVEDHFRNTLLSIIPIVVSTLAMLISFAALILAA